MYMRFLPMKVSEDKLQELAQWYRSRVIAALRETSGCLSARLLQPALPAGECLSLTLWEGREALEAHEDSDLFDELMNEAAAFLTHSSEWKAVLSDASGVGLEVPLKSPEAKAYEVVTSTGAGDTGPASPPLLHVRIVSLLVREGQAAVLAERYRRTIIPKLLTFKGCLAAFLVEGVTRPNQALSVTLWERDEDAVRYELSGVFDDLTEHLRGTLSSLHLWSLSLDATAARDDVVGSDLDVVRYSVVAGERFKAGTD
jgi:heme-degrading monooxygenase HmoA